MKKIYVVRKFVITNLIGDAIKKEKEHPVDDVFLDEDIRRKVLEVQTTDRNNIGFNK